MDKWNVYDASKGNKIVLRNVSYDDMTRKVNSSARFYGQNTSTNNVYPQGYRWQPGKK